MGNTYEIGKCPECQKIVVFDEGVQLTVTVSGTRALERAEKLLAEGMSLEDLEMIICSYCRNVKPCGCPKPTYPEQD